MNWNKEKYILLHIGVNAQYGQDCVLCGDALDMQNDVAFIEDKETHIIEMSCLACVGVVTK